VFRQKDGEIGLGLRRGGHAPEDEFVAFYAARADHLRNTAYLLCGDWHLAEDLTQIAVTKLYQAWHRLERHDTLDQYARRVLLRAFLDERRRPWRREFSIAPDSPALDTLSRDRIGTDDRMVLRSALLRIPKGRRAVLVLRFWADLSVEQVADLLGCTTGTVKSQTAHGLANLRAALGTGLEDLKRKLPGGPA
jgi:RNA polymerase sigma-70 factor (sigma-E family)